MLKLGHTRFIFVHSTAFFFFFFFFFFLSFSLSLFCIGIGYDVTAWTDGVSAYTFWQGQRSCFSLYFPDYLWGLFSLLSQWVSDCPRELSGSGLENDSWPPWNVRIKNVWSYTSTSVICMEIVMLLVMYFSPLSGTSCQLCGIISIMCIQTVVPRNIVVQTRQPDIRTSF